MLPGGCFVVVWPILDLTMYQSVADRREGYGSRLNLTVSDAGVSNNNIGIRNAAVDFELPESCRRVLGVDRYEILSPEEPLRSLRPGKFVVLCQAETRGCEVIAVHHAPVVQHNFRVHPASMPFRACRALPRILTSTSCRVSWPPPKPLLSSRSNVRLPSGAKPLCTGNCAVAAIR